MEKLDIHELIGHYYYFVDTQNKEAWLNLWAEEGHLQNGDNIARGTSTASTVCQRPYH
jgi:hypothetical protein